MLIHTPRVGDTALGIIDDQRLTSYDHVGDAHAAALHVKLCVLSSPVTPDCWSTGLKGSLDRLRLLTIVSRYRGSDPVGGVAYPIAPTESSPAVRTVVALRLPRATSLPTT